MSHRKYYQSHHSESTVNKQEGEVVLLDFDVGQPEFSPPGILSLTRVVAPILSPPHVYMVNDMNLKENMKQNCHLDSYFFGETSSKSDPTMFTSLVSKVMDSYNTHLTSTIGPSTSLGKEDLHGDNKKKQENTIYSKEYPQTLIVNTDGWVKGMGAEILSTIIDIVNPTHIIQILGHSKAKCFDLPSYCIPNECHLHVIETFSRGQNQLRETIQSSESFSRMPKITNNPGHAKSARLHALRFRAYFLGGADKLHSFQDIQFTHSGFKDPNGLLASIVGKMRPYTISLDSINFCIKAEEADIRDYLNANEKQSLTLDGLDATVVALCSTNNISHHEDLLHCPDEERLENILQQQTPRCLGLGIIRSIDRKRRLFYVLTPLLLSSLQSVNVIVGGGKYCCLLNFFAGWKRSLFFLSISMF